MRAVVLPAFGTPDVFVASDVPTPKPAAGQMLIKVAACGVCGHDLLSRSGHFPHTKLPAVIGHEIAGTVVEVGALITRFKHGDRVAVIQRIPCGSCALCRSGRENLCVSGSGFYGEELSGGYGEFVLASERNAVAVPDTIPLRIASVLSCAIGTGFHALRRSKLELGDSVLITAATGGVGLHTVKLARRKGLRVIAVSTSEAKSPLLRDAGADEVIVSPDLKFHKQARDLTGGEGVDAVIEVAGRPTFESSVRSIKGGGRMVIVGNVDPGPVALNPAMAILKEIDFIGSAHATVADLKKVLELVASGAIKPDIAKSLPIAEASSAHRLMEERKTIGRVVLLHDQTD
jgi:D-arabinose 1-dehydrogenase-like Zn-dependent alcohol dehydrogenase